jgi:TRAP-type mannitol/chloroaromatic compound transport system permease small subunit
MRDPMTFGEAISGLGSWLIWIFQQIVAGFGNILFALVSWIPGVGSEDSGPGLLEWVVWDNSTSDKQSLMKFIFYGGSIEFFFIVFNLFLVVTAIGLFINRSVLWGAVRGLEGFANTIGRIAAWAGLLMVLQQVIIVFLQRIFVRPNISLGFGIPVEFDVSWWAEELKLYNAAVVALCLAFTFVQGGHVRVDLLYAPAKFKTKRIIDMLGALFFMMPMAVLMWLYSWFFMWRHLVTPKVAASDKIELLLRKARILKWNVETMGPSPNGFTAYFLFKILIVLMCGMIFLQAVAFFYRSYLEWREGEASEGKYLDKEVLDQGDDAPAPAGH